MAIVNQRTIVVPFAELDAATVEEFETWLTRTWSIGEQPVVLDLAGVEFLSAAGIAVMTRLDAELDGGLRLVAVQPPVERILRLCQLDRWLL